MFELQDSEYSTVAYGTREEVFDAVKHRVPDGRYRIVGPQLLLYCIRIRGTVYPDPERVPMQRQANANLSSVRYRT